MVEINIIKLLFLCDKILTFFSEDQKDDKIFESVCWLKKWIWEGYEKIEKAVIANEDKRKLNFSFWEIAYLMENSKNVSKDRSQELNDLIAEWLGFVNQTSQNLCPFELIEDIEWALLMFKKNVKRKKIKKTF